MAIKTIEQSIDIDAPRERVWDVLVEDATYRQWAAEFMAGSYAQTDWQQGSAARFLDASGSGLAGHIVVSRRPEELTIEYDGVVAGGEVDHDSQEAREFAGAHETYRLTERSGGTSLAIRSDMGEQYYDEMDRAWVRALAKIKALAERT